MFLNYHHLMYFWTVAREGGVARAAESLHLSSPTISAQIRELEDVLGEKLFARRGRSLVLTEVGQTVYKYAEEIFTLGRELVEAVKLAPGARPRKLTVGVTDGMPKLVSLMLLEPALAMDPPISLVEVEGKDDELLANLATFKLDLVLSEAPLGVSGGGVQIRAYSQLLGESGTMFFGGKSMQAKYAKDFPASLDGAPVYLPTRNSSIRRGLDQFFDQQNLHPRILGEFEDSAMLNTFGAAGRALFPAPSLMEEAVAAMYNVKAVGRLDMVRARFYAISPERRLKHPGVAAICAAARKELFR